MIYLVTDNSTLKNYSTFKIISIEESLHLLNKCKILQYDSETIGKDPHICDLLCIQFGNKKQDFQIVIDTTTININNYKEVLETKMLVAHNAKFDLQFLYNYNIIPRNIYDTMIVEQFLHLGYPYTAISYSLKNILKERCNIDMDKTVRGEIIWRGLDQKVVEYSATDVLYLEDIMKLQMEDVRNIGAVEGAKLECSFVPVIAYLEWCGIKLDEQKWRDKIKHDKQRFYVAKENLDIFVIAHPKLQKFVSINRQGDLFLGYDLTPKCTINWASSQQVVEVAKLLGFNTQVKDKKTGDDKDSVLEKTLKVQKGINDKFLELYFEYKEYEKVVTSFGEAHLNAINPKTGRIHTVYKQLGATSGRLSCGSNQSNDDLAKYKGLKPSECIYINAQQLPSDEETRSSFVAEEGNYFCSCDYSAIESRLGADIYQEPAMLKEFLEGSGDMHSLCAKMVFSEELKDVEIKDIKDKRPDLRKLVKGVEFSKQFGGSAQAIAGALGCSMEKAQQFSDFYDKGFSGVTEFKKKGSKFVKEHGYIVICPITQHRMYWWDWKEWKKMEDFYKSPAWSWNDYKKNHKGTGDLTEKQVREHFKAAAKYDRMALNAPTQGCGAIVLKRAMTTFFNWIVDNGYFNIVKLCALVHDEACIEYPKSLKDTDKVLEKIMEEAAAIYCKSLPIPACAEVSDHWVH